MRQEAWIAAICLVALVLLVNFSLFAALRKRGVSNQFEPLARALKHARGAWQDEEDQINELAKRVAALHPSVQPDESEKESSDTG